ncbi:MAG: biotin/lipoyl-containing protein, partial [Pseudomonadales bacterium]
ERVLLVRGGERVEVDVLPSDEGFEISWEDGTVTASVRENARVVRENPEMLTGLIDDEPFVVHSVVEDDALELVWQGWRRTYALAFDHGALEVDAGGGSLSSPMPGQVVRIFVNVGDEVEAGAPLVVVEAMKMEHTISAPAGGRVEEVFYSVGDKVDEGVELVHLELET